MKLDDADHRVAARSRLTLEKTLNGATHWTEYPNAGRAIGNERHGGARMRRAHGLKSHPVKSFKVSNDPKFIETLEGIAGLYLNPPETTLIAAMDMLTGALLPITDQLQQHHEWLRFLK